jgi:Tfp pilus assembly protein PilO
MVSTWQRISIVLIRTSNFVRFGYTLLFLLGVISIWYFTWYKPLEEDRYYYKEGIAVLSAQQEKQRTLGKRYEKLQQLEKKIVQLAVHQVPQLLTWIITTASNNMLTVHSCMPQKRFNRHVYTFAPFKFSVEGTFESLTSFFTALTSSPYGFTCDQCTVRKGKSSSLLCTFVLTFFLGK